MNKSFYQVIPLEKPYFKKLKKKGLTKVWPGDGEPYF